MGRAARFITVSTLFALLIWAIIAAAFGRWSPWTARYVHGVDVSAHQGPIDWRALAADDVRFAYIKATEGGDFVDERFVINWSAARDAGVLVGAYHFFTLCRPAAQQAAHFIATLPEDRAGMLPPAVDLEHMGPCRRGPTMTDVAGETRVFLDAVQRATGMRPILYTTREFHDAHLRDINGEAFWLRSLFTPPDFRRREWLIWQHHNRASKAGVPGPIDLNAFRGTEAELRRLANVTANEDAPAP
jgi:lysozyme